MRNAWSNLKFREKRRLTFNCKFRGFFGLIFGVIQTATGIGFALGPWLTGLIYDTSGTYLPALKGMLEIYVISVAGIVLTSALQSQFLTAGHFSCTGFAYSPELNVNLYLSPR